MDARQDFSLLAAANCIRLDDCQRPFYRQVILLRDGMMQ
jgi:hypothetical protein